MIFQKNRHIFRMIANTIFLFALIGSLILISGCSSKGHSSKPAAGEQTISIQNTTALTLKDITIKINDNQETILETLQPFSTEPISFPAEDDSSDLNDSSVQNITISCDRGDGVRFGKYFHEAFPEQIILTAEESEYGEFSFSVNSIEDF